MSFRSDYSKENAQSQQFMSFLAKNLKENAQSQQFVSFPVKNSKENAKKGSPVITGYHFLHIFCCFICRKALNKG